MGHRIETVVFDLDGTLYLNNDFYRDYIHFLLEDTDKVEWEDDLIRYAAGVCSGEHLVMNTYYRSGVIRSDSSKEFFSRLEEAYLPEMRYEEALCRGDCIYLGDVWAVVTLIGKALGVLDGERIETVYRRTREKMSMDGMEGNPRLRNAIEALGRRCNTVLLSNSYEETARDFLRQLGFEHVFRKEIFSANKPWSMAEKLMEQGVDLDAEPQCVLSVGDHAFNDLMPMGRLGCKTLWVNPFGKIHEPVYDMAVHTLDELACCLEGMCW